MIQRGLLILSAGLAFAQGSPSGNVGPDCIMSGSATLDSGIEIAFASYAIPGGSWAAALRNEVSGIADGGDVVHRYQIVPDGDTYLGYDLTITGDATAGFRAVFRPPTRQPLTIDGRPKPNVTSPKFPPAQSVRDGDVIALELMVSPDGSRRLIDYIRISMQRPEPPAPSGAVEPRDFTIDDGPVTYDASRMTVWINGVKQGVRTSFNANRIIGAGSLGATFWVAFPSRGRYILSLVPHEGLVKAGVARDNVLQFQDSGVQYEVRFMSPIAGKGKAWNLWVFHDAAYDPGPPPRAAIMSGVDRLEALLPAR